VKTPVVPAGWRKKETGGKDKAVHQKDEAGRFPPTRFEKRMRNFFEER